MRGGVIYHIPMYTWGYNFCLLSHFIRVKMQVESNYLVLFAFFFSKKYLRRFVEINLKSKKKKRKISICIITKIVLNSTFLLPSFIFTFLNLYTCFFKIKKRRKSFSAVVAVSLGVQSLFLEKGKSLQLSGFSFIYIASKVVKSS